jgi:hypothetical protein
MLEKMRFLVLAEPRHVKVASATHESCLPLAGEGSSIGRRVTFQCGLLHVQATRKGREASRLCGCAIIALFPGKALELWICNAWR